MVREFVQYEKIENIGIITLNRPKCLNAINIQMLSEFSGLLEECAEDDHTQVLILTGAGRGFCSGLDMADEKIVNPGKDIKTRHIYGMQRKFSQAILRMRRCPQPIIGAINGAAAGAGFSFALACDVRLAAPKAKFTAAYINIGVGGADMGSSWLFPRIVGAGNAARYLLTGDLFSAEEGFRMGLVQEIVEEDFLMEKTLKIAETMAAKSYLGLRLTKEALNVNMCGISLEDAVKLEDRNQTICITELTGGLVRG